MLLILAALGVSCGDDVTGTQVRMEFDLVGEDFFAAPLPSEARDAHAVVGFPTTGAGFMTSLFGLLEAPTGAGTTSSIFFTTDAPLHPDVEQSYDESTEDAPVLLVRIDAPDPSHPIEVRFREDGGPFGADNLLSILPLQGRPLAPNAVYAAVLRTSILDAEGHALAVHPSVRDTGRLPGHARAMFETALSTLEARGIADIAGLTVFRTQDPVAPMRALAAAVLEEPRPVVASFELLETHSNFCVYESAVAMPTYQAGEPPFSTEGGRIAFVDDVPQRVGEEQARFFVTIPRTAMPGGGYPVVLFSRTGGGGDRPLIDRGVRDETGVPVEAGSGPAREFADVGWAGASIDGPHGGIRNPAGSDEQLLIFNFTNPPAMLDNIRQSALELVLAAHLLDDVVLDATGCEGSGAEAARFDTTNLTLMGHSMGATIAPLALAVEPKFRGAILSGAGGSWIANVVHKESPLAVRPIAELLLRISGRHQLHEHDPSLMLLQWAGESADPPVFGDAIRDNGVHVLMLQGIVDTYILPPMANATSVSLGLDLGGESLDAAEARLDAFRSLDSVLPYSLGDRVSLPAAGNQDTVTRVVTQHLEDGIEDGHEVAFQNDLPKAQYRCFLETLQATGTPTVPSSATDCPAL